MLENCAMLKLYLGLEPVESRNEPSIALTA